MDSIDIQGAIQARSSVRFLQCVEQALRCGHYKQVQAFISAALPEGHDPAFVVDVLREAITGLAPAQTQTAAAPAPTLPWNASIPFLLLELVQGSMQPSLTTGVGSRAAQDCGGSSNEAARPAGSMAAQSAALELLRTCCSTGNAKLGLRVAQAYGISWDTVQGGGMADDVGTCVRGLLESEDGPSVYPLAVGWLMHLEGLDEWLAVDTATLLAQLVAAGQESTAEKWAERLGYDAQVLYVEHCLVAERLKAAARGVRSFGLHEDFPDVEKMYRQRSFDRLVERGLWAVATQFAGSDVAMQKQLVAELARVDVEQARGLVTKLGLPSTFVDELPPQPVGAALLTSDQYLPLALPLECVVLVDSRDALAAAAPVLAAASVLGLDSEWRPVGASKAALLQLATPEAAVLIDLYGLLAAPGLGPDEVMANAAALDAALGPPFRNTACLKLGFELVGDLGKLAGSWPQVSAFATVNCAFELRELWLEHLKTRGNGNVTRMQRMGGLSVLALGLLGRKLDKSMQVSDWEQRPLSTRQRVYAAQDAHVLVRLYGRLLEVVPHAAEVVATRKFNYLAHHGRERRSLDGGGPRGPPHGGGGGGGGSGGHGGGSGGVAGGSGTSGGAVGGQQQPSSKNDVGARAPAGCRSGPSTSSSSYNAITSNGHTGLSMSVGTSACASVSGTSAGTSTSQLPGSASKAGSSGQQQPGALGTGMPDAGTPARVLDALIRAGLSLSLITVPPGSSVATAMDAAQVLSVPCSRIAKSVAFWGSPTADGHITGPTARSPLPAPQPWLAVVRGDQRLDMHKVALATGCGRKSLRIASWEECVAVWGYAAGTLPPFGHITPGIQVLLDVRLMASCDGSLSPACRQIAPEQQPSPLYVGTGCHSSVVGLSFDQLVRLSDGRTVDVAAAPSTAADDIAVGSSGRQGAEATQAAQAAGNGWEHAPGSAEPEVGPPPFLLDSQLGRLCRWLRCLGVDAELAPAGLNWQQLAALAVQAVGSGRVFLTRDKSLAMRRDCAAAAPYLLSDNDPAAQLREVSGRWGISYDPARAMSRCSDCNASDYRRLDAAAAQALVPQKVLACVNEFWQCGGCAKVVWMGPKSYSAIQLVEGLLGEHHAADASATVLKTGAAKGNSLDVQVLVQESRWRLGRFVDSSCILQSNYDKRAAR